MAQIASIAVKYDKNGVDVRFFNAYLEDEERLNLDSADKVMELFENLYPDGSTPTADMIETELNEYLHDYRKNRSIKGLNLIVLTDGEPSPCQDVEGVIVKYARILAEQDAPPLQVGIQFVQISDDQGAKDLLENLDNDLQKKHGLDRDMVDTVPWVDGDEDRLHEKILLGGILKRLDNDEYEKTKAA